MSVREQHQRTKKLAIKKAMELLRGEGAYDNMECIILDAKRFPEEVQGSLWEAVAEVQDEWLSRIGAAAIAYLEEKLDQWDRRNSDRQTAEPDRQMVRQASAPVQAIRVCAKVRQRPGSHAGGSSSSENQEGKNVP